jgi:hypothetical protein
LRGEQQRATTRDTPADAVLFKHPGFILEPNPETILSSWEAIVKIEKVNIRSSNSILVIGRVGHRVPRLTTRLRLPRCTDRLVCAPVLRAGEEFDRVAAGAVVEASHRQAARETPAGTGLSPEPSAAPLAPPVLAGGRTESVVGTEGAAQHGTLHNPTPKNNFRCFAFRHRFGSERRLEFSGMWE